MKRIQIIYYLFTVILSSTLLQSCKFGENQNQTTKKQMEDYAYADWKYKSLKVGDTLNMAYADIGNTLDPMVVLLHGEPNSSFVYREIAPPIVKRGFRVIMPDLIGFGHSEKPSNTETITYSNHTKWLSDFFQTLNLKNVNLYAHDWGAMISLRIVAEQPEIFEKVAISYGYLHDGTEGIPESFKGFKEYAKKDANFSAGNIMNWGSYKKLSDSIIAKYDEPFKNTDFVAARRFPWLIPENPSDQEAILNKKLNEELKNFNKPFITIWGNHNDPMWVGKDSILQKNIKGAQNQKHYLLESNHFIQEDKPEELVEILIEFFKKNN